MCLHVCLGSRFAAFFLGEGGGGLAKRQEGDQQQGAAKPPQLGSAIRERQAKLNQQTQHIHVGAR